MYYISILTTPDGIIRTELTVFQSLIHAPSSLTPPLHFSFPFDTVHNAYEKIKFKFCYMKNFNAFIHQKPISKKS